MKLNDIIKLNNIKKWMKINIKCPCKLDKKCCNTLICNYKNCFLLGDKLNEK